ncbi:MAG: hypothetical protein EOO01_04610 [Chitinophagaceae bacterium]|nr:MAG: hypothetical protein EOO01_04610 [Chitinophagaceae bacterium]
MKNQVQFLLLFLLLNLYAFSQVKISQMPTYSGNASVSDLQFPAVVNGQNVKVPVKTLIGDKLDSLTISEDSSLYTWKNGVPTFIKQLNFLKNQFAEKQSAKAWLDSIRASGISLDSFFRLYNPETGRLHAEYKDQTFYMYNSAKSYGLNSSINNVAQLPPVFYVNTMANGIDSAIRSEGISRFDHDWNVDTGKTVWGQNVILGTVPLHARLKIRFMPNNNGVPYNWRSDQWSLSAPIKGVMSLGGTDGKIKPTDSIKITTQNGWSAPSNVFMYSDFNNGGIVQHTAGSLINANSYWQLSSVVGSNMNDVIDYYAGGFASGRPNMGSRSFVLFAEETGLDRFINPWGVFIKGLKRRNYFGGSLLIGDSSALNQNGNKLYVSGPSKFNGNIFQSTGRTILSGAIDDGSTALQVKGSISLQQSGNEHHVINSSGSTKALFLNAGQTLQSGGYFMAYPAGYTGGDGASAEIGFNTATNASAKFQVYDAADWSLKMRIYKDRTHIYNFLNLSTSFTPTSTTDSRGAIGDIARDNEYIYLKTSSGWKRSPAFSNF